MTICIHRNLNVPSLDGGHVWSVKGYKTAKTLGKLQRHHDPSIEGNLTMSGCVWRVSTAGVNQVKKRGRRQVCAWLQGEHHGVAPSGFPVGRLSYNPMVNPETAHIVDDSGNVVRVIRSGDDIGTVQATADGLFVY